MPRIALSLSDWHAVALELSAAHTAIAPPGLVDRIEALLTQAPRGWSDQAYALELDESSAEAVRAVHAVLIGTDRGAGQRADSVAEAIRIIHEHQQRG